MGSIPYATIMMITFRAALRCPKAQAGERAPHLIDLINHAEGTAVELLQRHQVQHGGHTALTPALVVRRQLVQLCAAAELDADPDAVLVIVLLRNVHTAGEGPGVPGTHVTTVQNQTE